MASLTPRPVDNVEPLRPIRVLVSSHDRRFLAAAAFLLARRRFWVESVRGREALLARVEATGVDVVVLDATDSVAAAARVAGAIEGRHPRTRVILLTEDATEPAGALRILPKWGALERLGEEIVHAYGSGSL